MAYAIVSKTEIPKLQKSHKDSQWDQFVMRLYIEFEYIRSKLMNKDPLPSLDASMNCWEKNNVSPLKTSLLEEKLTMIFIMLMLLRSNPATMI